MEPELRLLPLTEERLPAFASLLGGPAFGGCFCAVWCHHDSATWPARCADPARPNLQATAADLRSGRAVGYLVQLQGQTVAWTGAGPWAEFPALQHRLAARLAPQSERAQAWVIGCLAIAPTHRGNGLCEAIVRSVLHLAHSAGAASVHAFPTRPWDEPRSYRGSLGLYSRLGFCEQAAELDGDVEILWMRRQLP